MFEIDGKYGNVHIDGRSINIESLDKYKLETYLENLENEREKIMEEQNNILSKIIN